MIEIMSPNPIPNKSFSSRVFMAGSIEMGKAENWQMKFKNAVSDLDIILLNPRRDDWDPNWIQSIHDSKFNEQVTWELDNIKASDYLIFYFDPKTMSPITLMELGYSSSTCYFDIIVCCPDGFWRKGNVEILCNRMGYKLVDTFEDLVKEFRESYGRFE